MKFIIVADDALIEEFCLYNGYEPTALDEKGQTIPNPTTPQEFCQGRIEVFLKQGIVGKRMNDAFARTKADVMAQAEAIVVDVKPEKE